MLVLLLLAGCASPATEPAPDDALLTDALALEGCVVHQAILDISFEDARALVPEAFEVAAYPGVGAAGSPDGARMDAPFVNCERAFVEGRAIGPFTYFGVGIVIVPPEGTAASNLTAYFGLGAMASPPEAARVLRAWNVNPLDDGVATLVRTSSAPTQDTDAIAQSAAGEARMSDRLAPVKPLARPAEINRIYGVNGTAFEYQIQPHDAGLGDAVFTVDAQDGWLASVPTPRGAQVSAHAASPEWNVVIARVAG